MNLSFAALDLLFFLGPFLIYYSVRLRSESSNTWCQCHSKCRIILILCCRIVFSSFTVQKPLYQSSVACLICLILVSLQVPLRKRQCFLLISAGSLSHFFLDHLFEVSIQ